MDAGEGVALRGARAGHAMNPDRWRRIKEVFHLALDRAPEERAPFLDNACAGDDELRAEVERLLIAHVNAGSFIETSPVAGLAQQSAPVTTTLTGRALDHYRSAASSAPAGWVRSMPRTTPISIARSRSRSSQRRQRGGAARASARSAARLAAQSPEYLHDSRGRRVRGPGVHRHGVHRRAVR